jgi:putative alpha-1,2-mannosidase
MVPFNLKGLADAMGGVTVAATRLDTFFTQLNAGSESQYAYLGNEPCLETPWEYDFFGEPYKTQEFVRKAMTELFSSQPVGFPGNDDLGEMSSWYVFAALGIYPELPGADILVIGSPLFQKAVVHLRDGDVTITAEGSADDAPYVQNLKVNGKTCNKPWIRFTDISNGGTMEYDLGNSPDIKWGSATDDAPPSYQ